MADVMGWFKVIILVQLFFSFGITSLSYYIGEFPSTAPYAKITSYTDLANRIDLSNTATDIQESLESQTNIPVLDVGALVFYSGNILLDLLLNFAFAIPQMINLLISGILGIFNISNEIGNLLQLFASVVVMIMYFIGIMELLTGIRSGRTVGA